jgi:hypothetical protein
MNIINLEGGDQALYHVVAPLVMNEEVLRYNLNYPYKTSPDYLWFIATDNGNTLGFIPVKRKKNKGKAKSTAKINNYYVMDNDSAVFSALLQEITKVLSFDYEIESITQAQHIPEFERNGFSAVLHWKRYAKMKVIRDEKECP